MYWLTESSIVPMLTGVFLVCVFLVFAYWEREKKMLYVAMVIGVLTSAIVVCESVIVTDRESVSSCVHELATMLQNNDKQGVIGYISKTRPDQIERVKAEMARLDFGQCRINGITSFEVTETGGKKTATVVFVAFARVRHDGLPELIPVQPEVTLEFEKNSSGQWRVTDYSYRRVHRGNL